jgi:hypothetical protein
MKLAYEAPNWTTANQINLNWTTWRQSKAALSNHHARSALFLDITQRRVEFCTNVLGQPISPKLKGQDIQKREKSKTEVK